MEFSDASCQVPGSNDTREGLQSLDLLDTFFLHRTAHLTSAVYFSFPGFLKQHQGPDTFDPDMLKVPTGPILALPAS